MKISRKTEILTGGFAANMCKKSCDFLGSKKGQVHVGSAKAIALVFSRSSDKRVVVPEALCMGLNRVTVWEYVLKLFVLEVVSNSPLYTAILFSIPVAPKTVCPSVINNWVWAWLRNILFSRIIYCYLLAIHKH